MIHQIEDAQRRSKVTPPNVERIHRAAGQKLTTWVIGSAATTPVTIAARKALHEKYLVRINMSTTEYKARLSQQARGASLPLTKGIPILLYPEEDPNRDDDAFIQWVHKARRLINVMVLIASASVVDVRLERKLCYDYTKLKAEGQLRAVFRSNYASATPVAASPNPDVVQNPPATTITG